MSQIPPMPPMTTAGEDFNYANWTADTVITLCNVPWSNDYRDTVIFDSRTALDNYIDTSGTTITLDDSVYGKPEQGVRIPIPFNVAYQYNYIRVYNPAQPIPGGDESRSFYYFITGVEYLAPNTTGITVQLDVWQTFIYDVTFGNAFIERGHIGIANLNAMINNGRTYLTEPEGLDIGGEYMIRERVREDMASSRVDGSSGDFSVIVATTQILSSPWGTVDNPRISTATGSLAEGLPNGTELYAMSSQKFFDFMDYIHDYPWISQSIVSVTAVPGLSRFSLSTSDVGLNGSNEFLLPKINNNITAESNIASLMPNFRGTITSHIPTRYQHLDKFKTSPYSLFEMTTYNGQPITIKPESWNSDDATFVELAHVVPPGQRISVYPYLYNRSSTADKESDTRGVYDDGGEFLDMASHISTFPQFTIVTNQGVAYLAQNSSSIAYQRDSADWAQQRAMRGAEVSFDQSSNAISSTQEQSRIAQDIARQQTAQQNTVAGQQAITGGIAQGLGGAAAGAMMGGGAGAVLGGVGGAVNSAVNYGIETSNNNANLAIQNQATRRNTRNQASSMEFNRDTNKNFADFAAKGDYENAIAGVNAKVQDIKNTQPTMVGQVGGEAFNLAMHGMGYSLKLKIIDTGAVERLGEFWLRFGYAVNKFSPMPSTLKVMDKFTYWKVKEIHAGGANMPETFKQAIRGIMEKGVTVWNDPNDIGTVDPGTNRPRTDRSFTIGW